MANPPKKTLKEYAEAAAERLGKSKNGSPPAKTDKKKLSDKPTKEKKK